MRLRGLFPNPTEPIHRSLRAASIRSRASDRSRPPSRLGSPWSSMLTARGLGKADRESMTPLRKRGHSRARLGHRSSLRRHLQRPSGPFGPRALAGTPSSDSWSARPSPCFRCQVLEPPETNRLLERPKGRTGSRRSSASTDLRTAAKTFTSFRSRPLSQRVMAVKIRPSARECAQARCPTVWNTGFVWGNVYSVASHHPAGVACDCSHPPS